MGNIINAINYATTEREWTYPEIKDEDNENNATINETTENGDLTLKVSSVDSELDSSDESLNSPDESLNSQDESLNSDESNAELNALPTPSYAEIIKQDKSTYIKLLEGETVAIQEVSSEAIEKSDVDECTEEEIKQALTEEANGEINEDHIELINEDDQMPGLIEDDDENDETPGLQESQDDEMPGLQNDEMTGLIDEDDDMPGLTDEHDQSERDDYENHNENYEDFLYKLSLTHYEELIKVINNSLFASDEVKTIFIPSSDILLNILNMEDEYVKFNILSPIFKANEYLESTIEGYTLSISTEDKRYVFKISNIL